MPGGGYDGYEGYNGTPAEISWEATLDALQKHLAQMPVDDDGRPQVTENLRRTFSVLPDKNWGNDQKVFIFGQLDVDKMIPVCRAGLCPWWPVFTARAYFGDLDGLKKIHEAFTADKGKESKPGMSATLTWLSFPHTLRKGVPNVIEPKVISQLLDWGADANYENGEWLRTALRSLETEQIRPFIEHGAALAHISRELGALRQANNRQQAEKVEAALPGAVFHTLADSESLLETRFIPGVSGMASLQTLFNFSARRVQEIYEAVHEGKVGLNSVSFADYDTAVLQKAAKKLEELGGKPDALQDLLDKPVRAGKPVLGGPRA
ncbi:MAG: hypothetical protein GC185_07465 [Alphaproteobacteria bacterium]|nr:hypothetical protein [Alphaproteobacteria bacterium]